MPVSLPRWLPFALLLALPLSATAQRSYNNWVNPNSGLPAPEVPKPKPAPKKPVKKSFFSAADSAAAAKKGYTLAVEMMPIYPGGYVVMLDYIEKHLRRPKGSPRRSGVVKVTYTVLKDGTVANVHVRPGNGLDERYDAAAVQVISELKRFTGGKRNGEPVDMELTESIEFR